MFEIRETLTTGLGAFAKEDLSAGTVILREKPILRLPPLPWTSVNTFIPCSVLMHVFDALEEKQKQQIKELATVTPDKEVRHKVGLMVDVVLAQRKYKTSTSREEYVELMFQMTNNQWRHLRADDELNTLFIQLSRFNHSCVSNAVIHERILDDGSQVTILLARRNINAGEEITVEYVRPWTTSREGILRDWGFLCQCHFCTTMDIVTRLLYVDVFKQIRDNDGETCRDTNLTPQQTIMRHKRRAKALEFLGPSNTLFNEYAQLAGMYKATGDVKGLNETMSALQRVMAITCDKDDTKRAILDHLVSQQQH
ncbi:hypothetical protein F5Y14DRAFT_451940 [Nemania sp. NC0429]|nr:hypothetical protein F5Y14DRAFT_451940 [Nemania sp. NC0429]